MRLKLRSDALLTVGSGSHPVDLVSKSSDARVGLSEDEAAVAMLLVEGVPAGDGLIQLVQKHGVAWDMRTLDALLTKLRDAALLVEVSDAPAPAPVGPDTVEAPTEIFETPDTEVDALGAALGEDDVEELDDTDVHEVVDPLKLAFRVDVDVQQLADGNAEITDPNTGGRLHVGQDVLAVALLFDGRREVDDIVEAAALEGVTVNSETVQVLGQRLNSRGLLAPPDVSQQIQLRPMPTLQMGPLARQAAQRAQPAPAGAAEPGLDAASLAAALVLLRDHRYDEARQTLEPLLERNPDNAQAQMLLQLVATEAQRAARARRRKRLVRLLVGGGLTLVVLTALLVPVPERMTAPCALSPLSAGRIVSPDFSATVKELRLTQDALVNKGQLVAVLVDEEAERKLPRLRRVLAQEVDLLRIMRTGGTDEDERRNRLAAEKLAEELAARGRCAADDARCASERKRLQAALELASAKRKYCEWKAFPEEVAAAVKRVEQRRAEEAALKARLRTELHSPVAGVVVELNTARALPAKTELARLIDAERFDAEIATRKTPQGNSTIEIRQRKGAVVQSYYGSAREVEARGAKLRLRLAADTRKVAFGGVCEARFTPGRILLGVALWRKLTGQ